LEHLLLQFLWEKIRLELEKKRGQFNVEIKEL